MKNGLVVFGLSSAILLAACTGTENKPQPLVPFYRSSEPGTVIRQEPKARFPVRIAVARVALPREGDHSVLNRFEVTSSLDVESERLLTDIVQLPGVVEVVPVFRAVLPARTLSLRDLRFAAGKLKADMLLVYSVDNQATNNAEPIDTLSILTFRAAYKRHAAVGTAISGLLVDVQSEYLYAAIDGNAEDAANPSVFTADDYIRSAAKDVEAKAFQNFRNNLESQWVPLQAKYTLGQ